MKKIFFFFYIASLWTVPRNVSYDDHMIYIYTKKHYVCKNFIKNDKFIAYIAEVFHENTMAI